MQGPMQERIRGGRGPSGGAGEAGGGRGDGFGWGEHEGKLGSEPRKLQIFCPLGEVMRRHGLTCAE